MVRLLLRLSVVCRGGRQLSTEARPNGAGLAENC